MHYVFIWCAYFRRASIVSFSSFMVSMSSRICKSRPLAATIVTPTLDYSLIVFDIKTKNPFGI